MIDKPHIGATGKRDMGLKDILAMATGTLLQGVMPQPLLPFNRPNLVRMTCSFPGNHTLTEEARYLFQSNQMRTILQRL